jgi:hypothetical protein
MNIYPPLVEQNLLNKSIQYNLENTNTHVPTDNTQFGSDLFISSNK